MCGGFGFCGGAEFGQTLWVTDPQALGGQVGDLSALPGVGADAWGSVRARWQQSPPQAPGGGTITLEDLAQFMTELLMSNPFGTGQYVPYVNLHDGPGGKVVAITQRQLAFIVANALMGNDITTGNGLSSALRRCTMQEVATDILYSLLSMLAVLSKELQGAAQGNMLVAAKPKLKEAIGQSYAGPMQSGVGLAPVDLIVKVKNHDQFNQDIPDFMTGATPLQALTDIAGGNVGGGAALCRVANSQDESLMQFYSEVLAFSFYVPGDGMLQSPLTFLGTRRYLDKIEGDTNKEAPYFDHCGAIPEKDWINRDIMVDTQMVVIGQQQSSMVRSAFVAVQSAIQSGPGCPETEKVNNNCDGQRRHVDQDISFWYQAFEMTAYNPTVQGAFAALVRNIGTGPWGAGAWSGDSQQYFLTIWLATSLLSNPPKLNYFIYDQFCENPGNQCFVLGNKGCAECAGLAGKVPAERCGQQDIFNVVNQWQGQSAQALYQSLVNVGPPPQQVFDLIR